MWTPTGIFCNFCGIPIPRGTGVKPPYFFIHHDYCNQACMDAAEAKRLRDWQARLYRMEKYGRHWKVVDGNEDLVCITVYKKGAVEVMSRLRKAERLKAA